ncbi:metal-dependent hydrolase [Acinetobacter shaoyimingii]|uniref:Metal-dependent hydrolase n=1 Tax=Acinetobacter shaoyimingii TaxID=2715164 RepID=A0A6G8RZ25_9GAMM|nr:metal-dependent hydrolase [Acinetobacter shaoyimingii]QIO07189.1 metal-dependent hydrolase [Acinetobacter shaoyimingii]
MTNNNEAHQIIGRKVKFDFNQIPKHWIPNDPISTHILNVAHMILPAGEFWFCRVFNKALPYIKDEQLKADVKGFIQQEAIHGRTHQHAQIYFDQHEIDVKPFIQRMHFLFEILLGEKPLGIKALKYAVNEKRWLILRLGIIAAIEHYTGVAGQWSLDNTSLDHADPIMADLFRWHLAEEVEHRSVAFDLFEHMFETEFGFQMSKNALMAVILPLMALVWMEGGKAILKQDIDAGKYRNMGTLRLLMQVEKVSRKTDNIPTFSHLILATFRWFSPKFHPEQEGNTEQALAYLARSPSAQLAEREARLMKQQQPRFS